MNGNIQIVMSEWFHSFTEMSRGPARTAPTGRWLASSKATASDDYLEAASPTVRPEKPAASKYRVVPTTW